MGGEVVGEREGSEDRRKKGKQERKKNELTEIQE